MKIAVIGGTGMLGKLLVHEARAREHEVRGLSRSTPEHRIDLTTGEGLRAGLEGYEVVVDASNNPSSKGAVPTLVDGTRRLLAAEKEVGVRHHICVSIVGCDRVPARYLKTKVEQERAVEAGPIPYTIVRATQFHEVIAASLASLSRWGIVPLPRVRVQPVAGAEVARAILEVVEGQPRNGRLDVAGPQTQELSALAHQWRAFTGRRIALLSLPIPGAMGRALRDGGLTVETPDVRGALAFDEWLLPREKKAA